MSEGSLYTAVDAKRELGIPAGTVRSWASRGHIHSYGLDRSGRPMYRREDLARLAAEREESLRRVRQVAPSGS